MRLDRSNPEMFLTAEMQTYILANFASMDNSTLLENLRPMGFTRNFDAVRYFAKGKGLKKSREYLSFLRSSGYKKKAKLKADGIMPVKISRTKRITHPHPWLTVHRLLGD